MLSDYYVSKYPSDLIYAWLARVGDIDKREFSFTLENGAYLRYLSFDSIEKFKDSISQLRPVKIDIGAIYNIRPSERKSFGPGCLTPVMKELVFDIDVSDYDDIRTCCSGKEICSLCWKYCLFAAHLLDSTLREDFGCKHIAWIFSGRRGIHGWVFDRELMTLKSSQRSSLLSYFELPFAADGTGRRNISLSGHRYIRRLVDCSTQKFKEICLQDQQILQKEQTRNRILSLLPSDGLLFINLLDLRTDVARAWETLDPRDSVTMWAVFEAIAARHNSKALDDLDRLKREIVVTLMTPRIDVQVTSQISHLIKSPYSAHPDTGKISVPVSLNGDQFDPKCAPSFDAFVYKKDDAFEVDKHQ